MTHENRLDGDPGRAVPVRRPYFGKRLRELRETFVQRLGSGETGPMFLGKPSANMLIACMRTKGYDISSAAYNEVENGYNVPRDAVRFLEAVTDCLRLTEAEAKDLEERLAYDVLWARLRGRADHHIRPKPEWGPPAGED
jgi:hypothetical protein